MKELKQTLKELGLTGHLQVFSTFAALWVKFTGVPETSYGWFYNIDNGVFKLSDKVTAGVEPKYIPKSLNQLPTTLVIEEQELNTVIKL